MKARKDLSAKGLFNQVADSFRKLDNIYPKQGKIKTSDALLSCLAMFSLKYPSLLQFDIGQDEEVVKHNLNHLYNVSIVPSDTYMREMLDVISPLNLKDTYHNLFRIAQRGKVLERYLFMDKYYLVSADGTGFFLLTRFIAIRAARRSTLMVLRLIITKCLQQRLCILMSLLYYHLHPRQLLKKTVVKE